MTPKEKAEELRNKYMNVRWDINPDDAKQCALIAVDEIIYEVYDDLEWWKEVKQEIEKL